MSTRTPASHHAHADALAADRGGALCRRGRRPARDRRPRDRQHRRSPARAGADLRPARPVAGPQGARRRRSPLGRASRHAVPGRADGDGGRRHAAAAGRRRGRQCRRHHPVVAGRCARARRPRTVLSASWSVARWSSRRCRSCSTISRSACRSCSSISSTCRCRRPPRPNEGGTGRIRVVLGVSGQWQAGKAIAARTARGPPRSVALRPQAAPASSQEIKIAKNFGDSLVGPVGAAHPSSRWHWPLRLGSEHSEVGDQDRPQGRKNGQVGAKSSGLALLAGGVLGPPVG